VVQHGGADAAFHLVSTIFQAHDQDARSNVHVLTGDSLVSRCGEILSVSDCSLAAATFRN